MKLKSALILIYILLIIGASDLSATTVGNYNTNHSNLTEVASPQADFKVHSVKKGETIFSIAKKYDITVEDIYALNKWAERGIRVGDKLKIPKEKKTDKKEVKTENPTTVKPQPTSYKSHKVEPKQTLYSLGLIYNVSVEDILQSNPGLNENNFQVGKTIKIPVWSNTSANNQAQEATSGAKPKQESTTPSPEIIFIEHKVQKGETVYGISKAYNITEAELQAVNPSVVDGLKTDMILYIPKRQDKAITQNTQVAVTPESDPVQPTPVMQKGETMRIGILLPFTDKNGAISQDRLVEYYNGFLLGVKDMKAKGYNAEIYAFDAGAGHDTKKLKSLLETVEFENLHLVIGGVSPQQIALLTDFSARTGIKYVIPFGAKREGAGANIYQMTTSHSYLYPKIAAIFQNRFKDHNIVFISEPGSDNSKQSFVDDLKKELSAAGITFKSINSSGDTAKEMKASLDSSKKTMFIPTSSSEASLKRILALMNTLPKDKVTLFGYPDWQAYTLQYEHLHRYNAYIYSIFFLDEKNSRVEKEMNEYKKWYNKRLLNSYPKYAFLGYDVAAYFMTALNNYGSSFGERISDIKTPTLQSSVFFESDIKDGGYINTGIYFVRFKPDSSFEKIEYNKW